MTCLWSLAKYQAEHVQIETQRGRIMIPKDTHVLGSRELNNSCSLHRTDVLLPISQCGENSFHMIGSKEAML